MPNRMFKPVISLLLILLPYSLVARHTDLRKQLQQFVEGRDMLIGVAVIRNGVDTLTINNNDRYPLMSVVKLHQAMAVAHHFDRENLPLDTKIYISKKELHPDTYSPLRDKYLQGGVYLSLAELLTFTLQWSDNNACDVLFRHTGGPAATDRYVRSLGISDFAIKVTEDEMHKDLKTCYDNWSTPLAAAQTVELLVGTDLIPSPFREFIRQTLVSCETGKDRLPRPLLGTNAIVGHKTGTGDRNTDGKIIGVNDVGFVVLPDGSRYTIAVFIRDSGESLQTTSQIIGDISQIVHTYFSNEKQYNTL